MGEEKEGIERGERLTENVINEPVRGILYIISNLVGGQNSKFHDGPEEGLLLLLLRYRLYLTKQVSQPNNGKRGENPMLKTVAYLV